MTEENKKMPQISVSVPKTYMEWLDKVVEMEIYSSKSEVLRMALRDFIQKESPFIQNLKFDLQKLNDIHRKYIEFKENVIEKISPQISTGGFIND